MNRIKKAAEKTTREWVPPWTTGENGTLWPKGKVITPRPCTILELEKRADLFRAIGQDIAADLLEIEILKGRC